MQGELGGVGVKCRLPAADRQQLLQAAENPAVIRTGVGQLPLQLVGVPLVAIDGAVVAAVLHPLVVVARRHQAVQVDPGNALQRQHDGVGADEALQAPAVGAGQGALQRVVQGDIDFVGLALPALQRPVGHLATERLHGAYQRLQFLV